MADIRFFDTLLPDTGRILELGCGTGRISGALAGDRRPLTGIDISPHMVQRATQKKHPYCTYVCMDMTRIALQTRYDHIVIAYNTLNLLCSKTAILACLQGCRKHLRPGGTLLLQLFLPTRDFIARKKSFQFQLFDRPGGGKIIREVLKRYAGSTRYVHISERFRVRPMVPDGKNEDYQTSYCIAAYSAAGWLTILQKAGFTPAKLYSDYCGKPFRWGTSSLLLGSFSSL